MATALPTIPAIKRDGRSRIKRNAGSAGVVFILSMLAISVLYPIFFVVATSLKTYDDYVGNRFGFPRTVTLDNFKRALDAGVQRGFINSLMIVVPAVVGSLLISSIAGYAFSTMKFRGREPLLRTILMVTFIPGLVILIPLFVMVAKAGLLNQRWVLSVLYMGIAQPFAVYFMTNYMRSLPREVLDAASLDGASKIQIYFQMILPLARPALATIALIDFLGFWNELLWALLFITKPENRTLTVIVSVLQGDQHISIPEVCSGVLLAALPVFLLYLILQEHLIKGLAAGAVKS